MPEANLNTTPFPATVRSVDELWVSVCAYPVISKELMVVDAESVEAEVELASKQTSSVEVGTEALFAPPELVAQLVFPVAFQAALDPPPTQYRVQAKAWLLRAKKAATKTRTSKRCFIFCRVICIE